MRSVLLIVVNDPAFFLSHRLPVAEGARLAGFDVHIATMPGKAVDDIRALGFEHHALPLTRSGKNPFAELKAFFFLWCLLWRLRPDVLHLVTIKPVLYGGIAARLAPVKGVVAAISGLGFVFLASGFKARLMRGLVSLLYRLALGKDKLLAIFQNPDDRDALIKLGALASHKTVLIRGSGVRLSAYKVLPEPEGDAVVVTLAARLLWDKGVGEFVEAARVLKARGVNAVFQLVGDLDPDNPTSITLAELESWRSGKDVVVMGYRQDIANVFAASHLVVLPSYREGLPKVLVEAAACGRAVLTTDVPGCRDAIDPNVTGLLVPVRDVGALADAMEKLIKDPGGRQQIGKSGRELAEREFAIEKIVKQHLDIYEKLRDGI